MKRKSFPDLDPVSRRRFLSKMWQAAPFLWGTPLGLALDDIFMGSSAAAAPPPGTNYIEINLRDQWDFSQVFLPPGLCRPNVQRGEEKGKACLYYKSLVTTRNGFNLTEDGLPLKPHCEHIAVIETCQPNSGLIHGHDAANDMRSPGYSYSQSGKGSKRLPMWLEDVPEGKVYATGNENMYSSVPTPLYVHASYLKDYKVASTPWIFKGNSRNMEAYHFKADIKNITVNRAYSREQLAQILRFDAVTGFSPDEKAALYQSLSRLSKEYFKNHPLGTEVFTENYNEIVTAVLQGGHAPFHFTLSPEEVSFWSEGIPEQNKIYSSNSQLPNTIKAQIWEQTAWAYKALSAGISRSISLEFDYIDHHAPFREEAYMKILAQQTVLPLTRLISKLKADQIFDKTLIAVFTCDGSRTPDAASPGQADGKNAVILAGGMIQGGYYGDIQASMQGDKQFYTYHPPDPLTGAPSEVGRPAEKRLPGAHVWRTIMQALGIPQERVLRYGPDVSPGPLPYLLRT